MIDPGGRRRGWLSYIDPAVIGGTALIMTGLYLLAYARHPAHPHIGGSPGWWKWFDQERYFSAATAWSHWDLSPAAHYYLPGYALIAAPFISVFSVHAFLVANLICLLLSMWLFSKIVAELAKPIPHAPALGALIFAATTTVSPLALQIWVVPWSTTGATPLLYACLLFAIHFVREPHRWSLAFQAGIAGTLAGAFRPTDPVPIMLACAAGMTAGLVRGWRGWRHAIAVVLAGGAGVAVSVCVSVAIYVAIYGLQRSNYAIGAGAIGFELRLVPLRWVTLFLDPQPLFSDGRGLLEAFPWIAVGLAGFGVFLVLRFPCSDRLQHLTVILAVILYVLLYLSFRDLQPGGLFRFSNYHYFKWTYPVFALYGALLLHSLIVGSGGRSAIAGVALLCLFILLPWRADLRVVGPAEDGAIGADGHSVSFYSGLTSVRDGFLVAARGSWGEIYFGPQQLIIGDKALAYFGDFRTFPRFAGFLLVPLRPLAAGPATLILHPNVVPDPSSSVLAVRQEVSFGLPCWLPAALYQCEPEWLLPPPPLPSDGVIVFNGAEAPFLTGAWSDSEIRARWTSGTEAGLRVRRPVARLFDLEILASAYVPTGSPPLDLHILIDGREVLARQISAVEPLLLTCQFSEAMRARPVASDAMTIEIRIGNPRSPKDYAPNSSDARMLGLYVQKVSLRPLPHP